MSARTSAVVVSVESMHARKVAETVSVVVVGGGYAGASLAYKLKGTTGVTVTLINPTPFSLTKPVSLRAAVFAGDWSSTALVPLENSADELVVGVAVGVDDVQKVVKLDDGRQVRFDILVLATGQKTSGPGWVPVCSSLEDAKASFLGTCQTFENAKKIVIIGGGATGVELAGEISDAHPSSNLTIVQSGSVLVASPHKPFSGKFHRIIKSELTKKGVIVKTNTRVEGLTRKDFDEHCLLIGERTLKLTSGETIAADLVCWCASTKPESGMYPSEWVNDEGRVKVDQFLHVVGKEDVYCIGDVNDVDELKSCYSANYHVDLVASNIRATVNKTTEPKFSSYTPVTAPVCFLAIGRSSGVAQLPVCAIVLGPFFLKRIKSQDLLSGRIWQAMCGISTPETWDVRLNTGGNRPDSSWWPALDMFSSGSRSSAAL